MFAARIAEADWPAHLGRMARFWSAVALMNGGYHGRPMQRHAALPVDAGAFRPLARAVPRDRGRAGAGTAAAEFVERAERIAASLEAGIALAQGRDLGRAGASGCRRRAVSAAMRLDPTETGFAIAAADLGALLDLPARRCGT